MFPHFFLSLTITNDNVLAGVTHNHEMEGIWCAISKLFCNNNKIVAYICNICPLEEPPFSVIRAAVLKVNPHELISGMF